MHGIEIRYYNIIYDLVDDVKEGDVGPAAADHCAKPCWATRRFSRSFKVSKVGNIAGCRVTDGTVERGASVRLIRDNVVVHEGKLSQLKRFKDDVKEVTAGMECGMAFEGYQDTRRRCHRMLPGGDDSTQLVSPILSVLRRERSIYNTTVNGPRPS